jgi:DNA repair protein RecO (recombination protein O)
MSEHHLTVKAFTLSAFSIREADRLLQLLTREHGLISAYAGGAARPKSRFVSCSMPFTLSEFVLYVKSGRYSVKNADVLYAFHGIHGDYERLAEASRLASLFADAARFDSGHTEMYELFGYALYALADRDDPAFSAALAAMRLMAGIGFAPHLANCVVCHAEAKAPFAFSRSAAGTLCTLHRAGVDDVTFMPEYLLRVLLHAERAPLERLLTVQSGEQERQLVLQWIWHYIEYTMEKAYPGLQPPEIIRWKKKEDARREV